MLQIKVSESWHETFLGARVGAVLLANVDNSRRAKPLVQWKQKVESSLREKYSGCSRAILLENTLDNINKEIEIDPDFTGALGFKASVLAHLDRVEEAKDFLAQYQEKRPAVKNTSDYEKVAPKIIKDVLLEGLIKAGLPKA